MLHSHTLTKQVLPFHLSDGSRHLQQFHHERFLSHLQEQIEFFLHFPDAFLGWKPDGRLSPHALPTSDASPEVRQRQPAGRSPPRRPSRRPLAERCFPRSPTVPRSATASAAPTRASRDAARRPALSPSLPAGRARYRRLSEPGGGRPALPCWSKSLRKSAMR